MADSSEELYETKSGGWMWLFLPVILFIVVGFGLSIGAYAFAEQDLTALESLAAGFGGLAGVIVALFATLIGLVLALFSTVIGLVIAAGSIAVTLFFVASPLIAIILFILLLRERKERNRAVEALTR